MALSKVQRITELISGVRAFRLCGPSDDSDEQTAVCVGYRHLVVQLQRLASPLLPDLERERLNRIVVEMDNIYSVYDAHAELETLLDDIENAVESVDTDVLNVRMAGRIVQPSLIERLEAVSSTTLPKSSSDSAKRSIRVLPTETLLQPYS